MKVLVAGFFDMLHIGHVSFLERAAAYGDLYVNVGNDDNMFLQKGKRPIINQSERKKMVQSLKCVKEAYVPFCISDIDFEESIRRFCPDVFCVNDDGDTKEKRDICSKYGIKYKVLMKRGKIPQSSTNLRKEIYMPYRLCLAGAGLDQPYLSKLHPGKNITISIEPTHEFMEKGGMATSTRNRAIKLWGNLPVGDEVENAETLFHYDNSPDNPFVNGFQDAVGIMKKGIVTCKYNGKYIPEDIKFVQDEEAYKFIEKHLFLVPLKPRPEDYDLFLDARFEEKNAWHCNLGTNLLETGIKTRDIFKFGLGMFLSYQGYIDTFPATFPKYIKDTIEKYEADYDIYGWKLTGAGGGGYLVLVSDDIIKEGLRIKIRR